MIKSVYLLVTTGSDKKDPAVEIFDGDKSVIDAVVEIALGRDTMFSKGTKVQAIYKVNFFSNSLEELVLRLADGAFKLIIRPTSASEGPSE